MLSRICATFLASCFCGQIIADDQNSPAAPTAAEASAKHSALSEEQITRGQTIRRLLVSGINFAREHGEWPNELSELKIENTPPLNYLGASVRFNDLDKDLRGQVQGVSPVCHESLTIFPNGVWVGYADGHIELVRDAAALRLALAQSEPARAALEKLGQRSAKVETPAAKPDAKLALKLVDDTGRPIAGAQIGCLLFNADYDSPRGRGRLLTSVGDEPSPQETTSDAEGRVEIQYQWFFFDDDPPDSLKPLIAYHKDRGLIAIETLKPEPFRPAADGRVSSMEVRLHPGVRVNGSLSRIGAPPPDRDETIWTNAYIYMLTGGRPRPMWSESKQLAFDFLLPPGDYLIEAYGEGTYSAHRFLRLTDDLQSVQLHLDLPPDQLTLLTGNPAPELQQVKAWKNGGPTTLKNLRGKWVVLDFWGYWCGPCVASMPELMKLHDEFGDKGLVVIAVHDDSVDSIEELDKNLENTKKERWKGRDLPFLVALDGGGELPIAGTTRSTKGATCAAYGVQSWPTTILIDPQGKVVGEHDPRGPELRELLEKELKPAK